MKKNNIHVLVMPSWYPTIEEPLNGIFFKEQSKNLYNFGLKVGVVYPEIRWLSRLNISSFYNNHFQTKEYIEDGILTLRKHGWNKYPKFPKRRGISVANEFIRLARKYIKKYGKPDIIHAHSALWGGYAAMVISKEYNIPYIITEHATYYARKLVKKWQKPYIKETFSNANRILAVSTPFAKILEEYTLGNEVQVLHNPVNVKFFQMSNNKNTNHFTFLNVAFLLHKKGIDVLLRSFKEAFDNDKNVKLKLGGDGPEKNNLMNLAKKLEIEDQVEFLGALSRDQVKKEMMENNVFVLPSRFETFGVVLIEALASGTPVISTKCGGPEDIVNKDVGKLISTDSIEELADALKFMYENYDKYDSKILRKYVNDNFSNEAITTKLLKIYKKILK